MAMAAFALRQNPARVRNKDSRCVILTQLVEAIQMMKHQLFVMSKAKYVRTRFYVTPYVSMSNTICVNQGNVKILPQGK
jgi:hypothetical protein